MTILGDWKEAEKTDPERVFQETWHEIESSLTPNKLYMVVGKDSDGKDILTPIGRFLAYDIHKRGLTNEQIKKLLDQFLPSNEDFANEHRVRLQPLDFDEVFGADAARKMAGTAMQSPSGKEITWSGVIQSGPALYRDARSAAAGDRLDDD